MKGQNNKEYIIIIDSFVKKLNGRVNVMKKEKTIYKLCISLLIILLVYYGMYLFFDLPLLYGTDLRPQWFPFYEEFREHITQFIKTRALPFYSWDMFLGTDFYSSKSYYLMGDIYNYIGLLFNLDFFKTALFINSIKLIVSALSMNYLLGKYNYNSNTRIIGSLLYAFSGWAIFFSGQLSFLSFYSFVPIYFSGIELYIKEKKVCLFVLSVTILILTNFYFFFTLSLLTTIYFIYRYYLLNQSIKGIVCSTIKLILFYLLGVIMSSVLSLPTILSLISNERLGNGNVSLFYELKVYFHYLMTSLIPNYLYIYRQNIFETNSHFSREICLYASTIIPLLITQVFVDKDKMFKKSTLLMYGILMIMMFVPMFGYVLHGFSDPSLRWLFFIILMNIIIVCKYIDSGNIDKVILKRTFIGIILILICLFPVSIIMFNLEFTDYYNQYIIFLIFAIVYYIIYKIVLTGKLNRYILTFIIIELSVSGFLLYYGMLNTSNNENYEYIQKVTTVLQNNKNELNNHLDYLDEQKGYSQYYRVYINQKDLYWDYSHNMSLFYDINGLMTYDSTYESSINKLKLLSDRLNVYESGWIFDITDPYLINFLSTKYALVSDEKYLVEGVRWRLIDNNYNGIKIYINEDYRSLGTSFSKVTSFKQEKDLSNLEDYVLCTNDCEKIAEYVGNDNTILENIEYGKNSLYGVSTSSDDTFMILSLPYNKGWSLTINGVETDYYDVNGGFIGFPLNKGNNEIFLTFTPSGFKIGLIFSFVSTVGFIIYFIYNYIRNKMVNPKI